MNITSKPKQNYHINSPYCQSKNLVGFCRREPLIRYAYARKASWDLNQHNANCVPVMSKTFSESLPVVDGKRVMTKRLDLFINRSTCKSARSGNRMAGSQ